MVHQPKLHTLQNRPAQGFALRRHEPAIVSFSTGGRERKLVMKPWLAATVGALCLVMFLSILGSSSYLFLRDDLVSSTLSRHARMQHAYEDRIAALRTQVDLVTSRQLLDQQAVEDRVARLMERQNKIGAMQLQTKHIFEKAGVNPDSFKKPAAKRKTISTSNSPQRADKNSGLRLGSLIGTSAPFSASKPTNQRFDVAFGSPELFDSLEASLEETENAQLAELKQLKKNADRKVAKLASILGKQGIRIPLDTGVGGPLIELKNGNRFIETVNALDASLDTLESVRKAAKFLPHGTPAPGQRISSRFGSRKDPFTGRRAVHGGLDFKAKRGTSVIATASGKVTKAGRLGGYGKLVEIDHGGGITTRYAHLSRIEVRVGQRVTRGVRIGKVGSTGRSTGPHLHYEVRRKGRVLNPIHYVRLAKHLKPYL